MGSFLDVRGKRKLLACNLFVRGIVCHKQSSLNNMLTFTSADGQYGSYLLLMVVDNISGPVSAGHGSERH